MKEHGRPSERGRRRTLVVSILIAGLVAAIPAAATATPHQHPYFEVWCTDSEGNVTQAETVDAHAVQFDKTPGGKDDAVARFSENYPFGLDCELIGPFTP